MINFKQSYIQNREILIVILAYIIGFTTAFIGFALTNGSAPQSSFDYVTERVQVVGVDELKLEATATLAMYEDGEGLFLTQAGTKRILTARSNSVTDEGPGFHYAIPLFVTSPDDKFIYYCEQKTMNDSHCSAYIYVIKSDSVYQVRYEEKHLKVELSHYARWSQEGTFQIENHISNSNITPWRLTGKSD